MAKIKRSTTTEISFEKVDPEMFRRKILDYANELFKTYQDSKKEVMELKKKIIASKQEGKDVFEYSVFNAPKGSQTKIGDFTR